MRSPPAEMVHHSPIEVKAPITGRTGRAQITEGALVGACYAH